MGMIFKAVRCYWAAVVSHGDPYCEDNHYERLLELVEAWGAPGEPVEAVPAGFIGQTAATGVTEAVFL